MILWHLWPNSVAPYGVEKVVCCRLNDGKLLYPPWRLLFDTFLCAKCGIAVAIDTTFNYMFYVK